MPDTVTEPPGPLPPGYKTNFTTLKKAAKSGDLAVVSARRIDGTAVALVCAVNRVNGEYRFVPIAEMISGNPYEMYQDFTK